MKSTRAKKSAGVKALPYEHATGGKRAVHEMQKILQAIGASAFGYMEEFDKAEVIVEFKWRALPVTIRASAKGDAAIWLRRHPCALVIAGSDPVCDPAAFTPTTSPNGIDCCARRPI